LAKLADVQEIPPPPKSAIANHYQSAPMSAKNQNKDGPMTGRSKFFIKPNQSSINMSNVRSADEISNHSIEESDLNPSTTFRKVNNHSLEYAQAGRLSTGCGQKSSPQPFTLPSPIPHASESFSKTSLGFMFGTVSRTN